MCDGGLGGEKADFNAPNAELKNLQMNMKSGQFISKERDAFVGKILVESLSAKVQFKQNLKVYLRANTEFKESLKGARIAKALMQKFAMK